MSAAEKKTVTIGWLVTVLLLLPNHLTYFKTTTTKITDGAIFHPFHPLLALLGWSGAGSEEKEVMKEG